MAMLAGVHYDGPLPLDLRVRREEKAEEHFSSKVTSLSKSTRKPKKELLIDTESFIQVGIVKQQKDLECFGLTANPSGSFEFQTVGARSLRPEYLATDVTDDLRNVTVKQEPPETDECIEPMFNSTEATFSLNDDLAYLTKIEEGHSSEEDPLIIDFDFESTSPTTRCLNRSNSNCSTNSNSSGASDVNEDVKAFVLSFAKDELFKIHRCDKCKMIFDDLHSLFVHLDLHPSRNPNERCIRCPACFRKFQKYRCIVAHIRKMHLGVLAYNCRHCHVPFKFQYHVKRHELRCRKNKKRHSLEECDSVGVV